MSIYARSPELMNAEDTVLCVVDVQEKLLRTIAEGSVIRWNIRRLLDACQVLHVPAIGTEQYPDGLGPTVPELLERLHEPVAKLTFSCVATAGFRDRLARLGPRNVLLTGLETHVCVQQTAFDLIAEGYRVFLAADAVGSRHVVDHTTALHRMETGGVTLTTTEAAIFEWCMEAGTERFRAIRPLVTEEKPAG